MATKFDVTFWVPTQYRMTLDAAEVAARLRAEGYTEGAAVAERIASGEITSGDAMDSYGCDLGALAHAIRKTGLADEAEAGEPTDTDTPEDFHVYVGAAVNTAGNAPTQLQRMHEAADRDDEHDTLTDLARRAGILWQCPRQHPDMPDFDCGWDNPEDEATCGGCGKERPACMDSECHLEACPEHPAHDGGDHTYEQHHDPADHVGDGPCRCMVYA